MPSRPQAPGLRWPRRNGKASPIWVAAADAVASGYRPTRVDLSYLATAPDQLKARCAVLHADLQLWRLGHRDDPARGDGSIRTILALYEQHPDSSFQRLRPWTQESYRTLLAELRVAIGERHPVDISGLDLIRWQRGWTANGRHLARGRQMRTVLLSALGFGAALRIEGCVDLATVIRATRQQFSAPPPRTTVITADEVVAARQAAHAAGRPSRALAYAIVYEVTLRLFDVIGRWWPSDRAPASDIIDDRGARWVGLRWEDVDDDLILRYVPSKTAASTGKRVVFPLALAPMVVQELRYWSLKRRVGPMIVNEATSLPYRPGAFQEGWRHDRKAAGIEKTAWARDLRASGITEGRAAGVSLDDAAKVAGHAGTRTTASVYDRAALEAAERFAAARVEQRRRRR